MRKIKFIHVIWTLFYITIFFILLNNSLSYLDADFGWHLKVGEQIVNDKSLPNAELYNYTLEGRTWVDHEWLLNAITYVIYNNFGYMALNVFFALIIVIALIIMNFIVQKYILERKNSIIIIIILQTLGIVASLPHLGVRMQEITLLNVSLLLLIIYHFNKHKNIKTLFFLLPLFYFWSSVHAGFLIGFFIMFFWIFIKFAEPFVEKIKFFNFIDYKNKLATKDVLKFSIFALLGLLTTFVTPYGLKLYSFLKYYANDYQFTHIQEWFPFYALPILYWQMLFSAFVVIIFIVILLNLYKKIDVKKITLWELAISFVFLVLSFKSKRNFPILFFVSIPLFINFFPSYFNLPKDHFLNKKWKKHYFIVKSYLIIGFVLIIASKIIGINYVSDPFDFFKLRYPSEAITFIKNSPEHNDKKIFNKYSWGGYLIWAWPEKKIFIDGRLPILPFKDHTFLEEYTEFSEENKSEEKLKEYNIRLVLIPSQEPYYKLNWFEKYFLMLNEEEINDYKNHLKNYLKNSTEWTEVYSDYVSVVYAKK